MVALAAGSSSRGTKISYQTKITAVMLTQLSLLAASGNDFDGVKA
jgi:hypothetical protein